MSELSIAQSAQIFTTDKPSMLALRLLEAGHGGDGFWYYSRPVGKGFESDWRAAGPHREPRADRTGQAMA